MVYSISYQHKIHKKFLSDEARLEMAIAEFTIYTKQF